LSLENAQNLVGLAKEYVGVKPLGKAATTINSCPQKPSPAPKPRGLAGFSVGVTAATCPYENLEATTKEE